MLVAELELSDVLPPPPPIDDGEPDEKPSAIIIAIGRNNPVGGFTVYECHPDDVHTVIARAHIETGQPSILVTPEPLAFIESWPLYSGALLDLAFFLAEPNSGNTFR
jgi:hypothetical protein